MPKEAICNGCKWENPETCKFCEAERKWLALVDQNKNKVTVHLATTLPYKALDGLDKAIIMRGVAN